MVAFFLVLEDFVGGFDESFPASFIFYSFFSFFFFGGEGICFVCLFVLLLVQITNFKTLHARVSLYTLLT